MHSLKWLSCFFTEKTDSGKCGAGSLQRSALWIGLAMVLQAFNEIGHDWFLSYFGMAGQLVPFGLYLGSFLALWQALRRGKYNGDSSEAPMVASLIFLLHAHIWLSWHLWSLGAASIRVSSIRPNTGMMELR